MILAQEFVWLHVPKTGGTWFRTAVEMYAPPGWNVKIIYPGHWGLDRIPASHADKPAIAHVRNPWDWYVSMFSFWSQHYWARTGGFAKNPSGWNADEREWARRIDQFKDFGPIVRDLVRHRSQACWHEMMTTPKTYIVRFEHLRADAVSVLTKLTGELPPDLARELAGGAPRMVSSHPPYAKLFANDPELVDKIREAEAPIIERFGYHFP